MRSFAKAASITVVVLVLLLALPVTYSTAKGYTTWWFSSKATVRINGASNGYLHRNWSGRAWIVTRTDLQPRQSYLVSLYGSKHVIDCGDWHAPRLPIYPFGDVNPPCLGLLTDSEIQRADLPHSSTLSVEPNMIEFTTMSGKNVSVTW